MEEFKCIPTNKGSREHNPTLLSNEVAKLDPQSLKLYKVLSLKFDEGKNDIVKQFQTWTVKAAEAFTELDSRVTLHDKEITRMNVAINKENVIIHGLRGINYDNQKIKEDVANKLNDLLELNLSKNDIYKIFVLRKKNPGGSEDESSQDSHPLKVCLMDLRTKCSIMNKRHLLQGKNIFINEDLPLELRNELKAKRLEAKSKKDKNKRGLSNDDGVSQLNKKMDLSNKNIHPSPMGN